MLRLSARRRRQAIRLGSLLVLLLAVMPQVLYLGHPGVGRDESVQRISRPGHEQHDKVAAEHANHCHVGPKGCAAADGVMHAAPLSNAISVMPQNGEFLEFDTSQTIRTFTLWQRLEKPPRPV
jgi:hypothetical protein